MFWFEEKMEDLFLEQDDVEVDDVDYDYRDWTNIPNPKKGKALKDLKGVVDPISKGWTEEEIISALKPTLIAAARKYATPTFSQDEALLAAMEGVFDALRTDKGIAPFTTHVFPAIKSKTMRSAAGTKEFPTSNISGIKPHEGGKTDFLKGSRATVSADAPVDDEGGGSTYAARISGDPHAGAEAEKEQLNTARLLASLFMSDDVGLNDTEQVVMRATYGINKEGEYTKKGAQNTSAIANALGVSKVRVSQIRKKAQEKIKEYLNSRGFGSPEEAMAAFGIEESRLIATARMVIESLSDILTIDMEYVKEHLDIPIDVKVGGVTRHSVAKFNTSTLAIDDVVAEGNESILMSIDGDALNEVYAIGNSRMGDEYFAETVSTIIKMHSQPVLGIIGDVDRSDEEDDNG